MANIFETAALSPEGRFLYVRITPGMIRQAKARFKKKVALTKGSSYDRDLTRDKWLGDLGEMVINQYLKYHKVDHDWQADGDIFATDFNVAGFKTEVKCQTINYKPQSNYWLNVRRDSALANTLAQHYVWTLFRPEEMILYLVGYMGRSMFMRDSVLFTKGQRITGSFEVLEDMHCVKIKQVARIEKWLALMQYQMKWKPLT